MSARLFGSALDAEHLPARYVTFVKCSVCGANDVYVQVDNGVQTPPVPRCVECEALRAAGSGPVVWVLKEKVDESTKILTVFSTKAKAERAKADVEAACRFTDGFSIVPFPLDLLKMEVA